MDNKAATDHHAIADNIERTVDKTALAKVRKLVDNFERDERAVKSKQFNVMLLTIIAIFVIAVLVIYLTGSGPRGSESRAAATKAAKADCVSRAVNRQRAALEQELRVTDPNLVGMELSRRLDSFNDMFTTAARTECRNAR